MISILTKLIKRIYRLVLHRSRVYGKYGKGNVFEWEVYVNESAEIGNYNYIGPYTMVNNARIGNYCSIAPGVKLGQGEHSIDFVTTYQKISKNLIDYSLNKKPTLIGNDVWIGANAVIMQDVKIGNGVVIGANSVVTKDIPDYSIAVGCPAKVLRLRFSNETIKEIIKSDWFNKDIDEAMMLIRKIDLGK